MKKRKIVLVLTTLVLCLSLLLQGCFFPALLKELEVYAETDSIYDIWEDWMESQPQEDSAESTQPEPSASADDTQPETEPASTHTSYEDFERLRESVLEPIAFDEIQYERPDAQAIIDGFHEVQELVESASGSLRDILDAFDSFYEDYRYFYTLGNYAYIRYTLDLNDSFYDEENTWCEEQSPLIEQAMEECFIAMGKSELRTELEEEYFGEGFFAYYDENQVYSNDRVVELMQRESALETEYMALQNEITIPWEGEEVLFDELISSPSLGYSDYMKAYERYYDKYNPKATKIFVELIKIRKEIAAELGYESYAHYAYKLDYERDYSPEQVAQYTDDIANYLSPYYYTAVYSTYSRSLDSETLMETLKDVAYSFGGEIATAYDYMMAYQLYDISVSSSKMPGSYVTYLDSYGMPYMYISPDGDSDDLLTASHEFGHFVDSYVNCGGASSIDCAEIFSQGLEFLSLDRFGLNTSQAEDLTLSKLCDCLLVFLAQGCYAEFEQKVYALPDEELTAENINALFWECNQKFGMGLPGMEDILAPGWIDIQHFFIAPCYVISYCVSNDAALQIYQNELDGGNGTELYRTLLSLSTDNTLLAMLEEAGMDSPFDPGRMEELAEFFDENLY